MHTNKRSKIDKQISIQAQKAKEATGLKLEYIANYCGVSFQQIQKYMNGTNRMSAGTLCVLAECFDLPIEYFYTKKAPIEYLRTKNIVSTDTD